MCLLVAERIRLTGDWVMTMYSLENMPIMRVRHRGAPIFRRFECTSNANAARTPVPGA